MVHILERHYASEHHLEGDKHHGLGLFGDCRIDGGFFWAIGLKYTNGWTRLTPSILTAAGMIVSFYFLSLAIKTLPMGTAYAVWTGIAPSVRL